MDLLIDRFIVEHKRLFGFVFDENDIVVESILVESGNQSRGEGLIEARLDDLGSKGDTAGRLATGRPWKIFSRGKYCQAGLFSRPDLAPGQVIRGPALITEATSTSVIESGWSTLVLDDGCLLVTKELADIEEKTCTDDLTAADPVQLELFNNIFMTVAEEMGITLQKVSHSVNIKERLDFSCAVFDRQGRLIANAPHMPVHLGSMGDSVVSLLKAHADHLKPGDSYVLNNPYNGGTHLPDLTVVSPVFGPAGQGSQPQLLFFVGSRGHHADIGGITPGSMPPASKNIEEEGVLIDNFKVVSSGQFLEQEFINLLKSARYPASAIPVKTSKT